MNISNKNNYGRFKYIKNFTKMFQTNIKENNDEIKGSDTYSNFRFHFFDIRNTLPDGMNIYMYGFNVNFNHCNCLFHFEVLIKKLDLFYQFIIDIKLKKNKHIYIDKILDEYSDSSIKKKINKIFDNNIVNLKIIIDKAKYLFEFAKKNILKYSSRLFTYEHIIKLNYIYILKDNFMTFMVVLTDLYFLRRFLDKKYIKNGILYTGLLHLYDISYLLVKYFNYKITNVFMYDPKFNISNDIKKLKFDNYEYLYTMNSHGTIRQPNLEISQCVNLIDFPPNFS
jgi:hypothetical protein